MICFFVVFNYLSSNDIKLFGTSSEPDIFPGNVNDLDIIDKFIGIWKNKVPKEETIYNI